MLNKKIAFIGPGVMAEAVIAGLLRKKLAKPENIIASGPREERGMELHQKYNIQHTTDNAYAASHADVVVLSIKPQRLSEVMKGLKGVKADALVISIIAGASMKKIGTGSETQGRGPLHAEYAGTNRSGHYRLGGVEGSHGRTAGDDARIFSARWARRSLSRMKAISTWQRPYPAPDLLMSSSSPRP